MARTTKEEPQYPGVLGQPVVIQGPPEAAEFLGADHPDIKAAKDAEALRAAQELTAKLPLLLDHFGIDRNRPDHWKQLAFRLARAHVPGMQVVNAPKAGAPQTWGPVELAALYIEVERLTKQGATAMDACRVLMRLPEGVWRFPRSRDAKTLYRRYQESKNSSVVGALQLTANFPDLHQIFQETIIEAVAKRSMENSG